MSWLEKNCSKFWEESGREWKMNSFQRESLADLVSHPVEWNCLLSQYTSFSIGGPADAVVRINKRDELSGILRFFAKEKVEWRVIGRGTNLLVQDSGFPGVILVLGEEFRAISSCSGNRPIDTDVRVGGGCSLGRLALNCMERGLTGLEFSGGIPGTVGGAVIMNAGSWGSELSSVIENLTLVSDAGERVIDRKDLNFGYRCWHDYREFSGKPIVVEVTFRLDRDEPGKIRAYSQTLQKKRKEKQPGSYATAGSFFKNPLNDSAGRLIEASGFKGVKVGGVQVSENHANFLVNQGGATAAEVLTLMCNIQEKVKRDSGIDLEPEIHFI